MLRESYDLGGGVEADLYGPGGSCDRKSRLRRCAQREVERNKVQCVVTMGKRGSACVFALQRVCACLAAVLYVCAHVTAAATCRSTRLSTAANVTIFPTDALTCTESPAPDGITGSFLLWVCVSSTCYSTSPHLA